jgi:RNA polymerase sigma factor (sigma-70 family)
MQSRPPDSENPSPQAAWSPEVAAAYERYAPGLRRMFMRRTGNHPEQTQELCQATWVEVWQLVSAGRYQRERAALSTFVYAVAQKQWLRFRREIGSRKRPITDSDERLAAWLDPSMGLGDAAHAAELLESLRNCLASRSGPNSLTAEERGVVEALMDGQTERAIAARLGVAPSTAHSWKSAALQKLRQCLTAKGFGPPAAEQGGAGRE